MLLEIKLNITPIVPITKESDLESKFDDTIKLRTSLGGTVMLTEAQ